MSETSSSAENTEIKEASVKLANFLASNPTARVDELEGATELAIFTPWNDETIVIKIPSEDDDFFKSLNELFLPERFSGIYHKDTKCLEIFYTSYPHPSEIQDVLDRNFDFIHMDTTYKCSFGDSSARTLHIAANFRAQRGPTSTQYRNLSSFQHYIQIGEHAESVGEEDESLQTYYKTLRPVSFWISDVEWNDDVILGMAQHLNFFMNYYDNRSPLIQIHSPKAENIVRQPQTRLPFGDFPKLIQGRLIEDNLLHFWHASRAGDPARRFLYNYQILEHTAFFLIEDEIAKTVKKLLLAPDAAHNATTIGAQIIESLAIAKMPEAQKIDNLIGRVVDPKRVWQEISVNSSIFQSEVKFDGGYVVKPLIKKDWSADDFATNWPGPFSSTLRGIRNALSHGKEYRQTKVITPTAANYERLQSWVPLVDVAAREAIVYRDLIS